MVVSTHLSSIDTLVEFSVLGVGCAMAEISLSNEALIKAAGTFYDAAARKGTWTEALEISGKLIGTSKLCLVAVNYVENQYDFVQNIGYSLDPYYEHKNDLNVIDPYSIELMSRQSVGKLFRNFEAVSKRDFFRSDAFGLLYGPSNTFNHTTTILARDKNNYAYFGAYTGVYDEGFSQEQQETMALLTPHICRALEIKATLDAATEPVASYIEETNGENAIFLLDDKAGFIAMNRTANDLVTNGQIFSIKASVLSHANSLDNEQLQSAIRACRKALEDDQSWAGINLTMKDETQKASLAVRVFPIYGQRTIISSIFRPVRPSIMVLVRETACINGIYEAELQSRYGLTVRESEIAANLCRGNRVKEIATQDSVSVNAVRFHLKNIFAKVEVKSQTELVAKILSKDH